MERVARGYVAQEWPSVFGGENEMNVNGGKGLWHVGKDAKAEAVRQRESALRIGVQSQRECVHQREHACRDLNAPTGHRPPAQGWRASAYLGCAFGKWKQRQRRVGRQPNVAATSLRCGSALKGGGGKPDDHESHLALQKNLQEAQFTF